MVPLKMVTSVPEESVFVKMVLKSINKNNVMESTLSENGA